MYSPVPPCAALILPLACTCGTESAPPIRPPFSCLRVLPPGHLHDTSLTSKLDIPPPPLEDETRFQNIAPYNIKRCIAVIRKWTRCSTPCAPVKSRSMRVSTILQKPTMPESRLKGICQSQLRKINMSTSLILHTRHSCTRAARSLSRSRNSRLAAADGEAKGMGRGKKFQIGDILVCILCLSLCVAASL
ncbi:hypothetical protein IG631_07838 [Alternaria alternata]|nr:hypothetical protein IG631_07838 [Alternaria alternata]